MNNKIIIITGINGFIGGHLARLLRIKYSLCEIVGIDRVKKESRYEVQAMDLLDRDKVYDAIRIIRPDYIFHLAGVVYSYNWDELYDGNIAITRNIFDAIQTNKLKTRVISVGSAAEYGIVQMDKLPISELCLPNPISLYGEIKLWQTFLARYYASLQLDVLVGRIFNVLGTGMSDKLSVGNLIKQVKSVMCGKHPPFIALKNQDVRRDYLDIVDVCNGLIYLALTGKSGEVYNICSGCPVTLYEILKILIAQTNMHIEITLDKNNRDEKYISCSCGDNSKVVASTGWRPTITLEESIRKLLDI